MDICHAILGAHHDIRSGSEAHVTIARLASSLCAVMSAVWQSQQAGDGALYPAWQLD